MMSLPIFAGAALLEILGCIAVWRWARHDGSVLWLLPGVVALLGFAWLLTLTPPDRAGRAFAAYAGVYLVAALLWLRFAEGESLRLTDLIGGLLALAGAAVILIGART